MDGSACSAAWASAGRQAPRITWAAMSTSILALRVALRSISVRMPKPCSASAARVPVRASSKPRSRVVLSAYPMLDLLT